MSPSDGMDLVAKIKNPSRESNPCSPVYESLMGILCDKYIQKQIPSNTLN
jgi:hypothetical protein